MSKVYKGDVGVRIRLCCFSDDEVALGSTISGASKVEMHVTYPTTHVTPKPDCPNGCSCDVIWTATAMTETGYEQYITYTTKEGDLDQVGAYSIQSYVEWGDGSRHHGDTYRLMISQPRT